VIVKFFLPKLCASFFCIFSARRLFENFHEKKKVALQRDALDKSMKMVRHDTEGMHAKVAALRRSL
jgi:hypothetical protein